MPVASSREGMSTTVENRVLWTPESLKIRLAIIGVITAITLAVHYHEWILEPIFGHIHWLHAIHGRLCYIPIVIAASWFGLRGGLYTAAIISVLVLPYALGYVGEAHARASELTEIVFYFAIATLTGVLVERQLRSRRRQQDAQLQMERSQKLSLVGQLAAGVAHEIKNPLASIKGAADILTDDQTSQADREEFKAILLNEIRRIDARITEILEFARPKEVRLDNLDLARTLTATVRQTEAHAKHEGVKMEADLQDGIVIKGDAEKLHQMALNLMLNAIQATEQGGTIAVALRNSADGEAHLTISDTGVGIEASDIDHIFDPFFTTRSSGTGLGLAVVKNIVDSHSGTIEVRRNPAGGTIVIVTFPRVDARDSR